MCWSLLTSPLLLTKEGTMAEVEEEEDERYKKRLRIQFLKRLRYDCYQSSKIVLEDLSYF